MGSLFNINIFKKALHLPKKYLLQFIGEGPVFAIQLNITDICNLKCKHCYKVSSINNEEELSLKDWQTIIIQYQKLAKDLNRQPRIILCGGEPLLSKLFFNIIEFIAFTFKDEKIEVAILTNGTLINEILLNNLEKYREHISVSFQVSLDGHSAEIHDKIRGDGAFDAAVKGIFFAKEYFYPVTTQTVLSKNTKIFIEDMFKLGQNLKVDSVNFTRLIKEGRAKITGGESLIGFELKDAYSKILEASKIFNLPTDTSKPLYNLIDPNLTGVNIMGYESIVIDSNGYFILSSRSQIRIGHALRDGIKNIFLNSSELKKLRSGRLNVCGKCPDIKKCGGDRNAAYAEFGDYFAADPGCWKYL